MRVLLLTKSLPYPATTAGRLRAYYLLRQLAQRHAVTLVSFHGTNPDAGHLRHLQSLCESLQLVEQPATPGRRAWRAIVAPHPSGGDHPARPQMERLVRRLLQEQTFDLIQAQQTVMAPYALLADEIPGRRTRLALDAFPVAHRQAELQHRLSGGLTRWRLQWPVERLRAYEAMLCRRCDAVFTVSAEEKGALLHLLPPEDAEAVAAKVTILPLGIDPDADDWTGPSPAEREPNILFLADFSRQQNVAAAAWFIGRALPLVYARLPEAGLTIAGPHPPEEMELLVSTSVMPPGVVTIAGPSFDPEALWRQSRVFIAPCVEPAGLVPAILEAWLRGAPVVATRAAVEGLSIRPGQTNLLADEPEAFAQAVVSLLTDDQMAEGISRNARHWVGRLYDWRRLYAELDGVIEGPAKN